MPTFILGGGGGGIRESPIPSMTQPAAGTGTTSALSDYGPARSIHAQLNVTAASGVTPTLDVVIQDSVDNGATWNTIGTFPQQTASGRAVVNVTTPFGPLLRVQWTIGGTAPSFTFAVDWYVRT